MTDGYNFLQFLYSKYSESEYLIESWTPIKEFLEEILQNSLENFQSTSYQTIYCQIYKTTCKGYQQRLFDDLKKIILEYCQTLQRQFDGYINDNHNSNVLNDNYILQFIDNLHRFHRIINGIIPIFVREYQNFLNISIHDYLALSVYIKAKLKTTIQHELLLIYKRILLETHLPHVFSALKQSCENISKEKIRLFLEMLHDIIPESMIEEREFFERYCNEENLSIRTNSKRSVDDLPGDEDQPSAKRSMPRIKSREYDE